MKLHRLDIKNIASIENATLDFDNDPIASADVFLISGPTGAGKSTLLDAISLALYGRVPRFGSARRNIDDFDNIAYNDVRQILRQGTGKGEITLSFDGNDGCFYESCWVVRRAHDKADRNFQRPEWTLVCNGDKASALTKSADIQDAIVRALGIDYEQFVRTSMLAQGEFTRFLKADDREKSEILTKLTRSEIYSQIGRKIYETTRDKLAEFEKKKALIAGEHLLEKEEEERLNAELAAVSEQACSEQTQLSADNKRLAWLERSLQLRQDTEAAQKKLAGAAAAVESGEIVALRSEAAAWRSSASARLCVRDIDMANIRIADANEALGQLRDKYSRLAGAFETLKAEARNKRFELENAEKALSAREWQAPAYADYDNINSLLDIVTDCRRRSAEALAKAAGKEKEKAGILDSAGKQEAVLKAAEEKLTAAASELREAEKNAGEYDLKTLADSHRKVQARINACLALQSDIDSYAAGKKAIDESKAALSAHVAATAEKEARLPSLRDALAKAGEARRISEDLVKVLDFSNQSWAVSARATLTDGCRCPVCLQTVAELPPMEAKLAEQWQLARRKAEEDRAAFDSALERLSNAEAEIKALSDAGNNERIRIGREEERIVKTRGALAERLQDIGLDDKCIENSGPLGRMKVDSEKELEILNVRIDEATAAQKRVGDLRTVLDAALKNRDNSLAAANKVRTALKVSETEAESLRKAAETADKEAASAAGNLNAKEVLAQWAEKSGRMFMSASDFKDYFTAEKKNYDSMRLSVETLRRDNERTDDAIGNLENLIASILEAMPAWKSVAAIPARDKNLVAGLNALASKVAAHTSALSAGNAAKTRLEAELKLFEAENPQFSEAEIRRLAAIDDKKAAEMENRLRLADDALLAARTALAELERQAAEHSGSQPEFAEGETPETIKENAARLTAHIAELHSRKGSIENRLRQNSDALGRVADLKAQADAADAEWRRWDLLNVHFGSATGDKFNRIAQSFVLRSLLDRANVHLARLTRRYRLCGVEGQYLILLEDAENDYRKRPVLTGSGGETFLVSLALALALAEEGRDVSTDILFIDEGFGTLSGEPLQRAVSMLRSLHSSSHKQVGIISHVEELKSEIPVQIQVTPSARGASAVEVVSLL